MRPIITVAALVALLLLALPAVAQEAPKPAAPAGETVYIGPKWTVGQTIRHKTINQSDSEQENPVLGKVDIKVHTTTVGVETVKSIDEKDNVTTELSYESIAVKQEQPGVELDWDSTREGADKDENAGVAIYKLMLKHKYTLKYNSAGKLAEVKGFDALVDEVLKTYDDEATRQMMRSVLEPSMGDKAMLRNMGSSHVFPGKLVAKGDSWDSKVEVAMPIGKGEMALAMKYKLDGLEAGKDGQLARISGEGTVKMAEKKEGEKKEEKKEADSPEEGEVQGLLNSMEFSIENGKQSVEAVFNVDRGVLVKQVTKQTMDVKIILAAMNMNVTQKTSNTITIELLPPKAEPEAKQPETGKSDK